jgi:hypothetical protein
MVQGYKRREFGEQPFSRPTPVDGSIKLVLSCNSPLVCSQSITIMGYKQDKVNNLITLSKLEQVNLK